MGCGATPTVPSLTTKPAAISGKVFGGQQPIANATIQLYTVGTSGDGVGSSPLLTQTVTTDGNGNFNITGLYSCSSATQVYLTVDGRVCERGAERECDADGGAGGVYLAECGDVHHDE